MRRQRESRTAGRRTPLALGVVALVAASVIAPGAVATADAQDAPSFTPAQIDSVTRARLDAGVEALDWSCRAEASGATRCYALEREAGEVRFGDGARGARPPSGQVRRPVLVLTPADSPDELAVIGRALAADPSSKDALARWRAVVLREAKAGRDPSLLVPRVLDAAAGALGGQATLQELALQNAMQERQRRFTLLSNIMKSLHDTAKNAIQNVR